VICSEQLKGPSGGREDFLILPGQLFTYGCPLASASLARFLPPAGGHHSVILLNGHMQALLAQSLWNQPGAALV
jgi:hypothetical protein